MDCKEKVVWITGASSGIGEALAHEFSRRGARLILSSNEELELQRTARDLGRDEKDVFPLPLDLAEVDGLEEAAGRARAKFGRVDVLVNNGGISQRSLVKDTGLSTYRRIMDIDFLGHVAVTLAVLPSMLERRSGHIVVTSSISGKVGVPLRSGYCAAKHALHGFFDTLRAEVWHDNIRVTIVCPTAVRTGISLHSLTGDGREYGKMSDHLQKGLTPALAARRIFRAVERGREEVIIGGDALRYAVYLKRFAPGIFSRVLNRVQIN